MLSLKSALKSRGLKQVDLARHLNKSKQHISYMCSDACYLDNDVLYSRTLSKNKKLEDNVVLRGVSKILDKV